MLRRTQLLGLSARLSALRAELASSPPPSSLLNQTNKRASPTVIPYGTFLTSASAAPAPAPSPPFSKQKPLTDSYNRLHNYLRISLTPLCNLRCTYCMPKNGVPRPDPDTLMTDEERIRVVRVLAGLSPVPLKIKLTGGEPLLHPTLSSLASSLSSTPNVSKVGITTNGALLTPKMIADLTPAVDSFNVSIDTTSRSAFSALTRRPAANLDRALSAVSLALSSGSSVKINTVLQRGFNTDPASVSGLLELGSSLGVPVRFIEWMPFSGTEDYESKFFPLSSLLSTVRSAGFELRPLPVSDPNDTTKWYAYEGGTFGVISSMSQNFCSTCNRLRLTSDGSMKVCLFSDTEVSLRDAMRDGCTDDEVGRIVGGALGGKEFKFGGAEGPEDLLSRREGNRVMTSIGG